MNDPFSDERDMAEFATQRRSDIATRLHDASGKTIHTCTAGGRFCIVCGQELNHTDRRANRVLTCSMRSTTEITDLISLARRAIAQGSEQVKGYSCGVLDALNWLHALGTDIEDIMDELGLSDAPPTNSHKPVETSNEQPFPCDTCRWVIGQDWRMCSRADTCAPNHFSQWEAKPSGEHLTTTGGDVHYRSAADPDRPLCRAGRYKFRATSEPVTCRRCLDMRKRQRVGSGQILLNTDPSAGRVIAKLEP